MAQLDQGVYFEPTKTTLGAWLDIWLSEYVQGKVKPFTVDSYRLQIKNHIKPALGAVYLSELNTTMIQRFYNSLEKNRGERAALSPKSIKNVHGVLHAALKKAAALRYIPYNPSDACELPVVQKKEIQPLDDTAIAAFLKAVQGSRFDILYQITVLLVCVKGKYLG